MVDDILKNGIPTEMAIIVGSPNSGKCHMAEYIARLKQAAVNSGHVVIFNSEMNYDSELSVKITKFGQQTVKDIQEYLEKNNIDINSPMVTKHEQIGDGIFPVTYGPNGIVIVDYPSQPLGKPKTFIQDNTDPIVLNMTNPIVQDSTNPIVQDNTDNIIQDNSW